MPSLDIKQIVDTKPLTFTLKTGGGRWKCQIHPNRASFERNGTPKAPGIARTDSGLSTTSSTGSIASSSSH
ncbi:hypothetical protein F4819DRAFT_493182 [Hypoxylon fuscum]|nr:hypothetical protein F4819DRAFT_493182 [Hypoxylon fuscum]